MVKEGLINLDFADVRSIMSEMGKAMMGTGEAAGDKRAVQAAEAAIANPLLDETSMRGARGLLISITGGNDLTLYEVDEAASRIRQEVDEEANIILGATFDSALDGVVRVSVVATGIDQDAIGQIEPVNAQPRAEAVARPRPFAPLRSARPAPAQADTPVAAAALASQEDAAGIVAAFREPIEARLEADELAQEEFISPAPEQPVVRAPRMPQIEDLPQLAQNQLRAMREGQNTLPAPETRRRSLLEKLAAFGITRHDGEAAPMPGAAPPPALATLPLQRPHALASAEPGRAQPRPRSTRSSGAPDPHSAPVLRPPVSEDDHLDIPAFLRRQQN
jgi:cell division protein FtsZ